jgi:hypothetical protein
MFVVGQPLNISFGYVYCFRRGHKASTINKSCRGMDVRFQGVVRRQRRYEGGTNGGCLIAGGQAWPSPFLFAASASAVASHVALTAAGIFAHSTTNFARSAGRSCLGVLLGVLGQTFGVSFVDFDGLSTRETGGFAAS